MRRYIGKAAVQNLRMKLLSSTYGCSNKEHFPMYVTLIPLCQFSPEKKETTIKGVRAVEEQEITKVAEKQNPVS